MKTTIKNSLITGVSIAILAFAAIPFVSNAAVSNIATYPADSISMDSAVLHGNVVETSDAGTCAWFEYSTNGFLQDIYTTQKECSIISYTAFNFHGGERVYNLQPNTTYYFRTVAQDSAGSTTIDYLHTQSFTTTAVQNNTNQDGYGQTSAHGAPAVETNSFSGLNYDSITLNALITPNDINTTAWFEYASGEAGFDNVNEDLGKKVGEKYIKYNDSERSYFSYVLENLEPGTLYYYRAVAENDNGKTEGAIYSFRTSAPNNGMFTGQPIVTTNGAMLVRETSALINGTINPNNTASSAWFEWSEDANLSAGTSKSVSQSVGQGTEDVYIAYALYNLTLGKTYYFRVVSQNTYGTSYGIINSFTTKAVPQPVVTAPTTPDTSAPAVSAPATVHKQIASANGSMTLEAEFDNDYPRPGKEVVYAISYKNNSDSTLSDATLNITLPNEAGFRNSSFANVNQDVNSISFKLGNVAAKGSGLVSVKVKITDLTKAESLKFKVNAAYSVGSKNGTDELISELKLNYTSLTASAIDMLGNMLNNLLVDLILGGLIGAGAYHFVLRKKQQLANNEDPLK